MNVAELLARVTGRTAPRKAAPVAVQRVTGSSPRDFLGAYRLYRRRIPARQRESFENILRWRSEFEAARPDRRARFEDYLLLAKAGSKVAGLLYGQYYPRTRLLLISYLVTDDRCPERQQVLPAILDALVRLGEGELRECAGLVFEVEHPDTSSRPMRCRAREGLFRALARERGMELRRLDIPYQQPRLSLWDPALREEPHHLMYARTRPPGLSDAAPRSEIATLLDAVYNDWYGDRYAAKPRRDAEYREYLADLCRALVARLPDPVPLK
ncbi:MAG TPA: hypothetical protein VMS93_03830 [Candidatus Saccharimonadales bacterium]|nr:hypothetical protein [Candidatus Saccharimonadales bacterium]